MSNTYRLLYSLFAAAWLGTGFALAQAPVPQEKIDELKSAFTAQQDSSSAARQRLAVKRVIRDGDKLLEAHPTAPNRFEILGVLFAAQQRLLSMDDSSRNREAFLETCRQLLKAPDAYAELRLDAELLLSQTELVRQGANAEARTAALKPFIARYRETPAEGKMLRVAMVMALELGDIRLIKELRNEMATRYAGDLDMINFQRAKLGGQIFGAPFCGTFKRSDGEIMHLPGDALGKTTILYFWSQKDPEDDHVQRLAAAWKEQLAEVAGRLSIISINLDELPDAGEKILRDLGVDWPALHFPGGRENPLYTTFPRRDPYMMTLSPTGYTALIMSGATRARRRTDSGLTDFARWFQSSLARDWSRPRYVNQLNSLFAGDFFVVDPEGPFDPTLPPEIKALSNQPTPLKRTATSVPEETLRAIQDCFVKAPLRYRLPVEEIKANYLKVEKLCEQAITEHAAAPDLWIVRNRRIVAQLGLWKWTSDHAHYQRAVAEAKIALDAGMPPGTDVIARFCLAKEALHDPEAEPQKVIKDFVEAMGGDKAPGPALAAASLLTLDISDCAMHEEYRELILEKHPDDPMLWTYTSFLLDGFHRYWLFRVPFVAGWSYGRQQQWLMSRGQVNEFERRIQAELQTLDGKPYSIPEDCAGKWTVVLFTNSWVDNKKSPLPSTVTRYLNPYIEKRGLDDIQVLVAVLDGEVTPIEAYLKEKPLNCETLMVPGGITHPLVQQLGILDEDERANALVLQPDGRIAATFSGLARSRTKSQEIPNLINAYDEQMIADLLEAGKVEQAKERILKLAPVYDPEAVDEKGRKLKKPEYAISHIRARAQVYLALKDRVAALADAEEVVLRLMQKGGHMSRRPEALNEAEDFRDSLRPVQDGAE